MKKLILLALMSTFVMSAFTTNTKLKSISVKSTDVELCKTSIKYAHAYKDTMGTNEAAKKALDYYKQDVVTNCGRICGTISAKVS